MGKLIDKSIFTQIQDHVDLYDVLPENHHGSRQDHTTTTAIIDMHEEMIEAYGRGESCAFIAIDQSAAYELIDHEILIEK